MLSNLLPTKVEDETKREDEIDGCCTSGGGSGFDRPASEAVERESDRSETESASSQLRPALEP